MHVLKSAKNYSLRQILLKKISLMLLSKPLPPPSWQVDKKKPRKYGREGGRLGRLGGGAGGGGLTGAHIAEDLTVSYIMGKAAN